jgi:hypothetical protein
MLFYICFLFCLLFIPTSPIPTFAIPTIIIATINFVIFIDVFIAVVTIAIAIAILITISVITDIMAVPISVYLCLKLSNDEYNCPIYAVSF